MTEDKLKQEQQGFLNREVWILTFIAGLGTRGTPVYAKSASDTDKDAFKLTFRQRVEQLAEESYKPSRPNSEQHTRNIEELSDSLSKEYSSVLDNGRLRIGVTQKLLNLYLKYQWCLGAIQEPPHCPFDGIILSKLGVAESVSWTKLDNANEYRRLVDLAKATAGPDQSVARWELTQFMA